MVLSFFFTDCDETWRPRSISVSCIVYTVNSNRVATVNVKAHFGAKFWVGAARGTRVTSRTKTMPRSYFPTFSGELEFFKTEVAHSEQTFNKVSDHAPLLGQCRRLGRVRGSGARWRVSWRSVAGVAPPLPPQDTLRVLAGDARRGGYRRRTARRCAARFADGCLCWVPSPPPGLLDERAAAALASQPSRPPLAQSPAAARPARRPRGAGRWDAARPAPPHKQSHTSAFIAQSGGHQGPFCPVRSVPRVAVGGPAPLLLATLASGSTSGTRALP